MSIPTATIKSFNDLIEIGTTLGKNWYRGHSKVFGNLTPRIFRERKTIPELMYGRPIHEVELKTIGNFKRYAPSMNIQLPQEDDTLGWLFIMQHHDFSTRLLDWTESILIASFFSVTEDKNEDGEIFSIFPWALNKMYNMNGLPLPKSKILQFLANEPLHTKPSDLIKEIGLKEIPKYPMAFLPPLSLPRMTAQMSAFTIHPKPSKTNSIEDLLTNKKELCRYIIPHSIKNDIEKKLAYLGISYRTLFPDLEGLSKSFKREERYYGWSQPKPPLFD
jgi:hypothetical protein